MKIVLDIETTVTNKSPSPFEPDNYMVCVGVMPVGKPDEAKVIWFDHNEVTVDSKQSHKELQDVLDKTTLLIAHNAKFDLSWLRECGFTYDGTIWDTMVVEYIYARGQKLALSLAECCKRWEVTQKKSELIEDYFKKGTGFEAMPKDIVEEYNIYDIISCGELYETQANLLKEDDYLSLKNIIELSNDMTDVLIDIERNGNAIDVEALDKVQKDYEEERKERAIQNTKIIKAVMGDRPYNLASPEQLSEIIWSRRVNDKEEWARTFNIGTTSSGKKKYRPRMSKIEFDRHMKRQTTIVSQTTVRQCPNCKGTGKQHKIKKDGTPYKVQPMCKHCLGTGYLYDATKSIAGFKFTPTHIQQVTAHGFATDKTTLGGLAAIAKQNNLDVAHTFLSNMQRINALDTYINSFCKGIRKNVINTILHPQLSQVRTGTGRLSSSRPNFQNLPRGSTALVRRAVVSRFPGGKILEADYGQLEFRVAVWMSDDAVGRKEIEDGFDVHAYTAKVLTEAGQTTSRQDAKARTFRPLYGGTKGSAAEVQYNNSFMDKYQGISSWHKELQEEAIAKKYITTVTGRQFAFPNVQRLRNGATDATKIKNYPVQSGATADIVPLACVLFHRSLKRLNLKSKFINTVHDSIVVDVHPDEIDVVCTTLYNDMMGVVRELKDKFDLTLDVPMEVELKIGDDWLDMDEISVDNQTNLNITEGNIIGELHDRECTNNQRHRQLTN